MCGIVGYIGQKEATPVLINALKKLEYRGYDSAGIAVFDGEDIVVRKAKGALKFLEEKIADEELIWATYKYRLKGGELEFAGYEFNDDWKKGLSIDEIVYHL